MQLLLIRTKYMLGEEDSVLRMRELGMWTWLVVIFLVDMLSFTYNGMT